MSRVEQFQTGSGADGGELTLRILSTSDLHMALLDWDYHADAPASRRGAPGGLEGLAARLADLRAGPAPTLLFDCGDFLEGGPLADFLALEGGLRQAEPHPMIAAMNALGYDAATLGNHDFSYGLAFLEQALAAARFPVICSNLQRRGPAGSMPLRPPQTLLVVTLHPGLPPLRVGVLGLAPPQTPRWEAARLGGALSASGMVAAARQRVGALRAVGADLVVALVHGGIGSGGADSAEENAALALAQLPGLDVLLLGHAHAVFPAPEPCGQPVGDGTARDRPGVDSRAGRLHGRPAVMPGQRGSHLGVVELGLRHGPQGWRHRCLAVRAEAMAPRRAGPDSSTAAVRRVAARAHDATRTHLAASIGRTRVRLHSYFAPLADCAALRLVAAAQRRWAETALRGRPEAALPLVSAVAPLRSGGHGGPTSYTDVPPGPLRLRHLHDLHAFPDLLCILRVTGADLVAWLEHAAASYATLTPERPDIPLLEHHAPGYGIDLLDGLSYRIDLGAPPRRHPGSPGRLRALRRADGGPVVPDAPFLLVTNSFRAAGGGGFPATGAAAEVLRMGPQTKRAAIIAHVRARTGPAAAPQGDWQLHAPPGSTAIFDTAPRARAHMHEIAALRPEILGLTAQGFLRLRLRF